MSVIVLWLAITLNVIVLLHNIRRTWIEMKRLRADRQELVDAYAEWRRMQQATMIQVQYVDTVQADEELTCRVHEGLPFGRN